MAPGGVIHTFTNVGDTSRGRSFPGFEPAQEREIFAIAPRMVEKRQLQAGDLVSFAADKCASIFAIVFDHRGKYATEALGLEPSVPLKLHEFEAQRIFDWCAAHGGSRATIDGAVIPLDDAVTLSANRPCTLWIAVPSPKDDVIFGRVSSTVSVTIKRAASKNVLLPEPLAEIRDEFTVNRGTARAYELEPGEFLQIIDVDGQQCSDFTAFRASGLDAGRELTIDSTSTRSMVRAAYPGPGLFDKFFDAELRPMMRVVQDTCGRHDTFGLACTARGYEERGFPGHVNCSDNISNATASYGVQARAAWPAINFFWNTWIDPASRQLMTEESHSRPGDYVTLQAMDRLVCVSTACPDDIDPINGWNPTDIHVRIYRPDAPIRRAVAYRVKEDAPMSISRESAFHPRTAALTQHFAPARDLWAPVSFPATGTVGEYWACREAVAVQDMSGLRKYDIVGPDAEKLLQRALTRDIARLAVWRGTYALMCDDTGAVIDDGTLFRLAPDLFRWCCGAEESARALSALVRDEGLNVRLTDMSDALVNLAIQGPNSRALFNRIIFTQPQVPPLDQVKWFGATVARLHDREGAPFLLTRTGYTGELGYEVFCAPSDAVDIWDAVVEAGQDLGLEPMGTDALNIIRIEAGLAAAGAEFAPGHDAYEAGLGFAVDLRKSDFVGKDALERNSKVPRKVLKGLSFDCMDVPHHGAPIFFGERQIGQVTSATRSPKFERTIAMARLAVEHAETGNTLEVGMMDGRMKRLSAVVTEIPFYDPNRERARA